MTVDENSPIHFLNGLTPDQAAVTDARAYARMLPTAGRVAGRIEDLCHCFSSFAADVAGPRLPSAHATALNVLAYAASGLYALLEDAQRPGMGDGWATLTRARLWAVDKCQAATAPLPPKAVEGLHLAFSNRHMLPTWAGEQGRTLEAGELAAWWTVAHLLEAAPHLEDGEAEDLTTAVLEALTPGPYPYARAAHLTTQLFAVQHEALPVNTAQYVEQMPGHMVRVGMGGGEFYEVSRAQVSFTPLPDGSAFLGLLVGTPDAHTVRLEPEDARTVCAVLGFDYPSPDGRGPVSHLN
ncbi:hypothetical protein [Deinococcus marmoris]|uniref:Uncharacterized protein n=1 Tax=Deinococcus marmoris TaxID=249408 RepID=A0A1U7NTX5_9DEIO|nr:hypothetical protein [Deinococcus marmoris]OLV16366.1 hypothetical protein BOO71_0012229 [Deinococcus marmoris]